MHANENQDCAVTVVRRGTVKGGRRVGLGADLERLGAHLFVVARADESQRPHTLVVRECFEPLLEKISAQFSIVDRLGEGQDEVVTFLEVQTDPTVEIDNPRNAVQAEVEREPRPLQWIDTNDPDRLPGVDIIGHRHLGSAQNGAGQ